MHSFPLFEQSALIEQFNIKEFEANFDGRDPKFLQFLQKDSNKELYQIVKSKSSELAVSQVDYVKNIALLSLKLLYQMMNETSKTQKI